MLLDKEQAHSRVSKAETIWLDKLNVEIRQYRIEFIDNTLSFADGYDPKTNTIYEFFGDYWHCNPNKYKSDYYNHVTHRTAQETWNKDKLYFQKLREAGYNIKLVWEHDFKYKKLLFSELNDYLVD